MNTLNDWFNKWIEKMTFTDANNFRNSPETNESKLSSEVLISLTQQEAQYLRTVLRGQLNLMTLDLEEYNSERSEAIKFYSNTKKNRFFSKRDKLQNAYKRLSAIQRKLRISLT